MSSDPEPTHAGGVVWRAAEAPRFLLVRPRRGGTEWVLPKGHVEPGESPESAAVREVREEAGVEAEVAGPPCVVEFAAPGGRVRAAYYPMRFRGPVTPAEEREVRWATFEEADRLLAHPEARRALHATRRRLNALDGEPGRMG